MLKTFYFQFIDPPFIKPIQVNVKECLTIEELTKKIAAYFNLPYYHFNVENQPKERLLEKITEKFVFILRLPNRRTDITFLFLKSITINLKNGYKLNYEEIIRSFQKSQLYYSNKCIQNHIQFKIFDKELPHIEYPLLAIPNGICVNVKIGCETVNLKYDINNFIFAENEKASEAFDLIKKTYEGCDSVLIQANKKKLTEFDSLKKSVSYEITVYYKVTFKNIENWDENLLYLDFLSTVSDVKKQLLYRLDKFENFENSKVILYNGNMQKIDNLSQMLKNIQDFSHFFYFEIKRKLPERLKILSSQNADYPMTPQPKSKSNFDYEIGRNSKTPEKKSKSPFFSKSDNQKSIHKRKKNQNQSSKSKPEENQMNSSLINEISPKTKSSNIKSNSNLSQKTKIKNHSNDFLSDSSKKEKEPKELNDNIDDDTDHSFAKENLTINEEEEEEFIEKNDNLSNDNYFDNEEEQRSEDYIEEDDLSNDSNKTLANSVDNNSLEIFEEDDNDN